MENLNAEKVISELRKNDSCYAEDIKAIQNAIALINSQDQKIKELTEEIKDLTETVEVKGKAVERLQILTNEIEEDNRKLTDENDRLRAEGENQSILWRQHFESIYETAKEMLEDAK